MNKIHLNKLALILIFSLFSSFKVFSNGFKKLKFKSNEYERYSLENESLDFLKLKIYKNGDELRIANILYFIQSF